MKRLIQSWVIWIDSKWITQILPAEKMELTCVSLHLEMSLRVWIVENDSSTRQMITLAIERLSAMPGHTDKYESTHSAMPNERNDNFNVSLPFPNTLLIVLRSGQRINILGFALHFFPKKKNPFQLPFNLEWIEAYGIDFLLIIEFSMEIISPAITWKQVTKHILINQ